MKNFFKICNLLIITSCIIGKSQKIELVMTEPLVEIMPNYHLIKYLSMGNFRGMAPKVSGIFGNLKYNNQKNIQCQRIHKTVGGDKRYSFHEVAQITRKRPISFSNTKAKLGEYFGVLNFKYPGSVKRVNSYIPVLLRYNCWKKKPRMRKGKTRIKPDYIGARFYTIGEKVPRNQRPNHAGFIWTQWVNVKMHKKPSKNSKVIENFNWVKQLYVVKKNKIKQTHFIKTVDHMKKGKVVTDYWYKVMTPYEEVGYVFGGYLTRNFEKVKKYVGLRNLPGPGHNIREFPDD